MGRNSALDAMVVLLKTVGVGDTNDNRCGVWVQCSVQKYSPNFQYIRSPFASRSRVINGNFTSLCELPVPSFAQRKLSITQIHQSRSVNIASVTTFLA